VPLVVEVCTQVVEECGLANQGIYRVPGNSLAINNLVEELNRVCMHSLVALFVSRCCMINWITVNARMVHVEGYLFVIILLTDVSLET